MLLMTLAIDDELGRRTPQKTWRDRTRELIKENMKIPGLS